MLLLMLTFVVFLVLVGNAGGFLLRQSFQKTKLPFFKHFLARNQESFLEIQDKDVYSIIQQEKKRQEQGVCLIASENFVSKAVLEALGSCMTNKYSEGLPGSRYYSGNVHVDKLELLCQQRALDLFGLSSEEWSVNVQPYSGSPANFAVYTALLQPGDRIMGLHLPSGGHLSHGHKTKKRNVSATSMYFNCQPYHTHPITGLIDYDEMETLAREFKPNLLIAGASAYVRDWNYERMRHIADSVGAPLMADIAHIAGIVAAKQCNNPFECCDVVTTTTHKTLRGPRSGLIFCRKQFETAINQAVFPALQGGPHNHQIAAVAVALREASTATFSDYIRTMKANAHVFATELLRFGYNLATNGTENHIVLWDIKSTTGLGGSIFQDALERHGIYVNKNSLAHDVSAINPGGIRIGTAAITTQGMQPSDIPALVQRIHDIVQHVIK